MLQPGTEVTHPQWGKGTVLFDKPHCIGIRFIEWGQVNFSQEEWAAQKSPSHRFRTIYDLEFTLESMVENGDLTEAQALHFHDMNVHRLELSPYQTANLHDAYVSFINSPNDSAAEDAFYSALIRYITSVVKRLAHNQATFRNIEDSIQESAIEVWQRLPQFNPERGSLRSWVKLITLHNVRDALKKFRTDRGNTQYAREGEVIAPNTIVLLDEDNAPPSHERNPEDRLLDSEKLRLTLGEMDSKDRQIAQMLTDGLTQQEIASALEISQSAVAQRLARLRKLIKTPL